MRKYTIQDMHDLAVKRRGKCLSQKYINARTRLKWECTNHHTWEATPDSIQRGSWCPECSGSKKRTIEDMQNLAISRGGKCISQIYVDSQTKLGWECAQKHTWEAIPNSIQQGSWCPECSGSKKKTIEAMQNLAITRGGKCLSTKYINARTRLKWECINHHTWDAIPDSIQRGSWCPECGGKKKKNS